ncbi:MAG: hypothetical protein ACRD7F_07260, partial [Nitrososphaeraceae archaeon]
IVSGPGVPFMSTAQDVDENNVNESKYIDKNSVILNLQNNFANISQYTNTTFINFLELHYIGCAIEIRKNFLIFNGVYSSHTRY